LLDLSLYELYCDARIHEHQVREFIGHLLSGYVYLHDEIAASAETSAHFYQTISLTECSSGTTQKLLIWS